MFHMTPSLRAPAILKLPNSDITIPAGNWNPCGLINYIQQQYPYVNFCFDPDTLTYFFTPELEVLPGTDDTILGALGLPAAGTYLNSTQPPNLAGPREIQIWTNLGVWNLPQCGLLAALPITCDYGGLITYYNTNDNAPSIITDHQIRFLEIHLKDENGLDLVCDDAVPWSIQIVLEETDTYAYTPLFKL